MERTASRNGKPNSSFNGHATTLLGAQETREFSASEIGLIRQQLKAGNEIASLAAAKRGYQLHPMIAEISKK